MLKRRIRIFTFFCLIFLGVSLCGGCQNNPQNTAGQDPAKEAKVSEYWTEGSEVAASLNEYLAAVTDETSKDFIPTEDRIAVFDLDGTLMCETYPFCFEYMVFADYAIKNADALPDEVVSVANEITEAAGGSKPDGMSTRQAAAGAVAYKGMTMKELSGIVADFKASDAWGFSGMTRGDAFYLPMVELFHTLIENDFSIYIVTATERNIVREVIRGTLDIPPSHVIGTEYGYTAVGQGDEADTEYTFQSGDQIVFDGNYYGENAKTSKVDAIVREIGQQPVLAFGNSSGDLAMEIYTISGNPYRSAAFMVLADDDEREFGDPESAEEKSEQYRAQGIEVISMKNDFRTIYGENVHKDSSAENVGVSSLESEGTFTEDFFAENAGVSYLGPEGTYTEEAAEFFFHSAGNFMPKETVEEAIEDAASEISDYAVIPQENTLGGAVTNYVDALLARDDVYVVGEVILPINQTLMGIPGTDIAEIKTVCSHAQGLKQTEQWRKENMPDAVAEEMASTAAAADYVAQEQNPSIAAIAAPGAAELYGLEVLAENVQITDANRTRFYVLSRERVTGGTNAVFAVSCEANRIDDIIVEIHDAELELVTMHDRPEGSALGKYNYIIEVENLDGISDDQINRISALDGIRWFGSFNTVEKDL